MSERPGLIERRQPYHGDRRRAALLQALDAFLREGDLGSVTVADVTARAGVTRSAFYFYFENLAAGVAALGADLYQEAMAAVDRVVDEDRSPRERIRNMIDEMIATWDRHHYIYRATLEASRKNASLRELWQGSRETFVGPIATMIETERAAGRAPDGPEAPLLATMLLDVSDRTLERLNPEDPQRVAAAADALVVVWLRVIYGSLDEN